MSAAGAFEMPLAALLRVVVHDADVVVLAHPAAHVLVLVRHDAHSLHGPFDRLVRSVFHGRQAGRPVPVLTRRGRSGALWPASYSPHGPALRLIPADPHPAHESLRHPGRPGGRRRVRGATERSARQSGAAGRRLPAHPRRAAARRQRPAEPGHLRHDVDGAAGPAS